MVRRSEKHWRRARTLSLACALALALAPAASAQLVTAGAGVLISARPEQPVFELHGETPPFADARAYVTLSWTDESWAPTIISAAELPVLRFEGAFTGIGAGLLWLEVNDYRPYPLLVSSTVVPLPVPRTSFVLIASTLAGPQDRRDPAVRPVGWRAISARLYA